MGCHSLTKVAEIEGGHGRTGYEFSYNSVGILLT
ncbi:hypothetical protein LCGC14_3091840, partial [marine sediment metagenome]